jgi:hypothetical protein
MLNKLKQIVGLLLVIALTACGGGGTEVAYRVNFSGSVTGLAAGQILIMEGKIPKTNQTVLITRMGSGNFSADIELPKGMNINDAGEAIVTVTNQPSDGSNCKLSFVSTAAITVVCTPKSTAAGLYQGAQTTAGLVNTNTYGQLVLLNNGSFWYFVGSRNSTSQFIINGLYTGTITSNNGQFQITQGQDVFLKSSDRLISGSGNYSDGKVNGSFRQGIATVTFNLEAPSLTTYSFLQKPTASTIAGNYRATIADSLRAENINFSVDGAGAFRSTTPLGCNISGSIVPLTTGENLYAMTVSFGGSPCAQPNATNAGILYLYTYTATGTTDFTAAVTNQSNNSGALILGSRVQ